MILPAICVVTRSPGARYHSSGTSHVGTVRSLRPGVDRVEEIACRRGVDTWHYFVSAWREADDVTCKACRKRFGL